ncbi:MAG: 3-phosphoserine/phosphohydroxythreonine transaminase [Burkholderiales bacterium]|nr:3-phosphoserine/phosphohydroxythreonine transaminase [Burkholderiales bacterium]
MQRPYNFSAGPATMPAEVLAQAAAEMLDWPDASGKPSGMGVMEMSHRGKEFQSIYEAAEADIRELLAVPANFKILFMQGGGLAENAIIPLNLAGMRAAPGTQGSADFVVTGSWSEKSLKEAGKYCQANVAANTKGGGFTAIPAPPSWKLDPSASYVHLCTNETINGVEFHSLPDLKALGSGAALVIDFSSHVASRPVDWNKVGLAFGGAQKNLGPAGLTMVVVREDLLGYSASICPSAFDYKTVADNQSMYNTPPTYAIYMAGLVFKWLKRQGGIAAMEARNMAKAELLYAALDASDFFYNKVHKDCRSRMNVPFFLRDESRNQAFLDGAKDAGLLQLKGHKSVGGMRASIYNAMPIEGVQTLVSYMREFEQKQA